MVSPPSVALVALATFVVVQRTAELRLARANEDWAQRRGATEFGREHYPLFFLLHGAWFVGWIAESLWRGPVLSRAFWLWLTLFVVAGALRYWAIATLGRRWNTRILVFAGVPPVRRGPYRWLAHPNYWAVALELLALPLVFGATYTALIASALNAALLLRIRIPTEEQALTLAARALDGNSDRGGVHQHPSGR
jgi:methyltransferase